MYAVMETGSKQYRVTAGDTLEIERLQVEAGKPFTFDRVLLVNNDGKLSSRFSRPSPDANVVAADVCVEHISRRQENRIQDETPEGLSPHRRRPPAGTHGIVKIKEIKAN